jgi:hypothetical protein
MGWFISRIGQTSKLDGIIARQAEGQGVKLVFEVNVSVAISP